MESKKIIKGLGLLGLASLLAACGGGAFDSSRGIAVVTREDGSGTKSAFKEIIGLKGAEDPEGVIVATGTAAVLQEVAGNPYAIAFDSLGYVTDEVKLLKVDGAEASVANIQSGDYSIARPLNVVYKQAEVTADPLLSAYLGFLSSSNAHEIISEEGYVVSGESSGAYSPVSGLSGSIAISGSTSLQPLMIILADEFESLQSGVSVEVAGGGSGTGYQNAENGVSDFGMISETFDSSRAPSCTYSTVAMDGIGIIVHKSNPLENISLSDLKAIYDPEDSSVSTWADLIDA